MRYNLTCLKGDPPPSVSTLNPDPSHNMKESRIYKFVPPPPAFHHLMHHFVLCGIMKEVDTRVQNKVGAF